MAHSPEHPEEFVCTNCQTTHAGTPEQSDGSHTFRPPAECGACGNTEFVEAVNWVHHHSAES